MIPSGVTEEGILYISITVHLQESSRSFAYFFNFLIKDYTI